MTIRRADFSFTYNGDKPSSQINYGTAGDCCYASPGKVGEFRNNFTGTGFYLADTWETVRFTTCFSTDSGDVLSYQYLLCCIFTLVEILLCF